MSPSPPSQPGPSPSPSPPSQQPPPSPPPPSGARSGSSSTGSSGAPSDFFADTGPRFEPGDDAAPEAPALDDGVGGLALEGWGEETVRELLTTQGHLFHMALRVAEADDQTTWKHTRDDLDRITPPLTRMLNRYDVTRAAAVAGDEISLISAFGTYGARNYVARRRLIARVRAQAVDVPVSGVAAEPGTGPPEPSDEEVDLSPPSLRPKGTHARG